MSNFFADTLDNLGTAFNLPDFGWSEGLAKGNSVNTGRVPYTSNSAFNTSSSPNQAIVNAAYAQRQNQPGGGNAVNGQQQMASGYANAGGAGGGAGGRVAVTAADLSFLDDQRNQLNSLLGRTNTGLSQALTRNQDEYARNLGQAEGDKARQYAAYEDKRVDANKGKLGAYDTLNRNAGNGYRSLAQIIGRAAGTGSSAFRELLPDVVGKETSSKRQDITDTYGENLAGIDKAQRNYDISFQSVLDDLLRQRNANEEQVRSGIESQRQNINQQLAQNAASRAQALGGGLAQARAAAAPFNQAIENSRNNVEGFFNQFRAAYTPRAAVAENPNLSEYTIDRSAVNAENTGGLGENPYADLIRRRLQGEGIV